MKVKIFTVTHKAYWFPEDSLYEPIQVGFKADLGILRDNIGDNISSKNKHYCELTALYWIYKNIQDLDYIGLDHYRRHFVSRVTRGDKQDKVLKESELVKYLNNNTVIVPKHRNYFIETNYSQYVHSHHEIDLIKTKEIITEKYPDYVDAYDKCMKSTCGHRFNMMIMPKDIFNSYCEWLFDILFTLEERLDISSYSDYDARVFGFISERLLDVYLIRNNYVTLEWPYVYMEKQNWLKKGMNFVIRKFHPTNK